MAGDWIKFELATIDKLEVLEMAEILNISSDDVVGKLLRVWGWFDQQSRDGNAGGVTGNALNRFIDTRVALPGFAAAMRKVRWLSDAGMPKFERHNGESSKKRAVTGKRVKRLRSAERNANGVTESLPEKRREECLEEPKGSSPGVAVVVGFPTNPPTSNTEITPGARVWLAYAAAYLDRYGVEPTRNLTVNSQLAAFVKRVPVEEAPHIAAWYVRSNEQQYVKKKHPIGILLSEAEKLRTEWATRKHGTEAAARQVDQTAARGDVFRNLIEELHGTDKNAA